MKRVISILGIGGLMEAIRALDRLITATFANLDPRVFTQAGSKVDITPIGVTWGLTRLAVSTR
jgi:hypothetical protein